MSTSPRQRTAHRSLPDAVPDACAASPQDGCFLRSVAASGVSSPSSHHRASSIPPVSTRSLARIPRPQRALRQKPCQSSRVIALMWHPANLAGPRMACCWSSEEGKWLWPRRHVHLRLWHPVESEFRPRRRGRGIAPAERGGVAMSVSKREHAPCAPAMMPYNVPDTSRRRGRVGLIAGVPVEGCGHAIHSRSAVGVGAGGRLSRGHLCAKRLSALPCR